MIIVSEEVVLTQTLALLPHHLIFGRIPKSLDTAGSTFLSFSSEPNITHTHTHTHTHIYIYRKSYQRSYWNGCKISAQQENVFVILIFKELHIIRITALKKIYTYIYIYIHT